MVGCEGLAGLAWFLGRRSFLYWGRSRIRVWLAGHFKEEEDSFVSGVSGILGQRGRSFAVGNGVFIADCYM